MSRQRRLAVWIAVLIGLPIAVAVLATAALAAAVGFGVSIDASRWRDTVAEHASAALGRPVSLQGALELKLGRELVLRLGALRIRNPPGFTGQEFLTAGEARARIDLLDLLRGRLRLLGVEATDVGLWLERAADGRGNWALPPRRDPQRPAAAIDIDQIALHSLALHYHEVRAATHRAVELDELTASLGRNDRLRLALRGRLEGNVPYSVTVYGGLRLVRDDSEPWPFTLDARTRGARLHANGAIDMRHATAGFGFTADAEDVQGIGSLVGATLPNLGAAALQGTVAAAADRVELNGLHGTLGDSDLSGQMTLVFGGSRPRLSGALSAAALDLRALFAADPDAPDKPLNSGGLARRALPLRDLAPLDIDVVLHVGRWIGLPIDLRDARFELHADAQGLRGPISATLASVPVAGSLELDTAASAPPKLALHLSANNARLGDLARSLADASGIEGSLGRLQLRIGGSGETLASLVHDAELSLAVSGAQVSCRFEVGAGPITGTLDTLTLAVRRGERLRAHARGTLLGEPATLALRAGTLPQMMRERATPLELDLLSAHSQLRVEGFVAHPQARRDSALAFAFQARRSGDLARWLGVAPESNLPVALRGRARRAADMWHLDATTLTLGRSELTIDARRSRADGRTLTVASVRSPLIDVPELATLGAGTNAGAGNEARRRIDAPMLGAAVELADADVALDLQRVLLGRIELAELVGDARTREGRLLPSPIRGRLAGAPFTSRIDLDPRGEVPMANLDLSTGAIDIGVLLRQLGLAEDIDGRADALQLKLQARGSTLRELAEHSAIEARVIGGSITVLGAAQHPVAEIRVNEANIGAPAGQPIRLRLDGALDDSAVQVELTTASFADFTRDNSRLPFAMTAHSALARFKLDGEVALPLGRDGQLTLELSGERLDALSALARVELPAWGPWSVRGPIRVTPGGYALPRLDVAVGSSRLSGSGTLDISGPRPRLEVKVAAPRIQLDDFPLPERLVDPPAPRRGEAAGLRGTATQLAGRTDRLLGAKFLRRFDATIDVKAKEVLSGTDRLADGALRLQLSDGRLNLDPLVVNLPGGSLRLTISYDLKESELEFAAAARVERFDYGIIARRLRRANDLKGLFSLDMALAGTAPSLDAIMQNASGRLDFVVWPTDLRSGVFNLWSVNLVLTLLPLIDPGGTPQVNCVVGRFDLKNGVLSDDRITIDTTSLRIRGTGQANLASEELAFVFRPSSKGFALFRLQTPLRVTGTLTDQRFGFTQRDVAESVLRLIAAPVVLPIEWLTRGPMPRDGADVCTDPLRVGAQ